MITSKPEWICDERERGEGGRGEGGKVKRRRGSSQGDLSIGEVDGQGVISLLFNLSDDRARLNFDA
jgi:hypothetical protein